ncbi:TetR/AcrR family transcriptional regulator [Pseudoteredinibacter isoporae]|uniref:AcrR family transcriptional regulator n=1 Tax=Pseudoteredinibacter isoporae TaxID=570281 RepID=A0A7X0MXV9_9GAMM|nr:TetR/AcrR family transcriptional regulator [Pseudoteredinibacter isoporae]MBB6521372.1 AcrR family transcriptional regulator [Pseudoteredinibacter isoporae]NHO86927.1 TetR/AcrR family transcriptional regulator [Pseudoteredinibacter isoporae]NIB24620.1 TetR/AcrR family transcriptional regulator [Pseudoteredinibacter isoporae]
MKNKDNNRTLNPRREPSQERARAKVEHILAVVRRILVEDGLEKLTTNYVAKQAEMSVGSLYRYFPNKQAIIYELYSRWLTETRQELSRYDSDESNGKSPVEVLSSIAREMTDLWNNDDRPAYELELDKAMKLYPELQEMDRQHARKLATIMANIYRRLGVNLGIEELLQLGYFSYELYGVYWNLMSEGNCKPELIYQWLERALLAVIEPHLEC